VSQDPAKEATSFVRPNSRQSNQRVTSSKASYSADLDTSDHINATIGFSELARETKIPSPSLQRMFGPSGNPSAQNLFGVIAALQRTEGVSIELQMHAS
jgi:hypothetical protein